MKAKVIRSEEAYEAALARVDALMDADAGSVDEEELELWALLVERYEELLAPDPVNLPELNAANPGGKLQAKSGDALTSCDYDALCIR